MRSLAPNTYADLRTGRRLRVAIARCKACAPDGFATAQEKLRQKIADGVSIESIAQRLRISERDVRLALREGWLHVHNLHVAATGERAYPTRRAA